MATATGLITDALNDLQVLGVGGTPSAKQLTHGLRRLNAMLELWGTSSLMIPFRSQISHTLDGSLSYTVGSGGDINTTRPIYIDNAFNQRNNVDYPVYVARSRDEYDRITKKNVEGIPRLVYYEPTYPLGTLFVYFAGNASDTLYLTVRGQLEQFADTTTDVDLPPSYYTMIYAMLAEDIAPSYEAAISIELAKKIRDSKAMIKRLNRQLPVMHYDGAIPRGRSYYNIESDS